MRALLSLPPHTLRSAPALTPTWALLPRTHRSWPPVARSAFSPGTEETRVELPAQKLSSFERVRDPLARNQQVTCGCGFPPFRFRAQTLKDPPLSPPAPSERAGTQPLGSDSRTKGFQVTEPPFPGAQIKPRTCVVVGGDVEALGGWRKRERGERDRSDRPCCLYRSDPALGTSLAPHSLPWGRPRARGGCLGIQGPGTSLATSGSPGAELGQAGRGREGRW